MDKDLIKQFNLPSYLSRAKTPADGSNMIKKKFEGRNEAETEKELLARLAKAQEYIKMQEALAANATQVPDMMDGQVPAGMEEFAPETNQAFLGGMFGAEGLQAAGGIGGIADGVGDIAGGLLGGGNEIDTSGAQSYDGMAAKNARTQGAIGGGVKAITGALTGNPVDLVTGLFGVGKSVLGAKDEQKKINQANSNVNTASTANLRSDFAYGGKVNSYEKGGNTDPRDPYYMQIGFDTTGGQSAPNVDASAYGASMGDASKFAGFVPKTQGDLFASTVDMTGAGSNEFSTPEDNKTGVGKGLDWLKNNAGELARLAPIAGNLFDKPERATTEQATKVTGRYARKLLDTQNAINRINQATNETGMASELSGGDLGAARNMGRVLDLNTKSAISDASYKGDVGERDEERFGTQIDQRNAQFNAQQDERYIDRKARDQGAYNTAKQARRNALYEDIGKIGKESGDKKLVREMFGYKWNGKYWTDNTGKSYTSAQVDNQISKQQENDKMFGGYLKKK